MTGVCLVLNRNLSILAVSCNLLHLLYELGASYWPSCSGYHERKISRETTGARRRMIQTIPLLLGFLRSCFAGLTCTYLLSHSYAALLLWLYAFVSASPPSCQGWCFWQTGTVICHRIAPSHLFAKPPRSESLPAETRKKRLASTHQSSRRLPSA